MCDADAEHLLRQNVMAEVSPELARSSSAAAQTGSPASQSHCPSVTALSISSVLINPQDRESPPPAHVREEHFGAGSYRPPQTAKNNTPSGAFPANQNDSPGPSDHGRASHDFDLDTTAPPKRFVTKCVREASAPKRRTALGLSERKMSPRTPLHANRTNYPQILTLRIDKLISKNRNLPHPVSMTFPKLRDYREFAVARPPAVSKRNRARDDRRSRGRSDHGAGL
jgi:hypothetical protein